MGEELEEQVPSVDEKQDDRHAMTQGQDITLLLVRRDRRPLSGSCGRDTEMECRGDEDGDHAEQKKGRVELGRGGGELLFGVAGAAAVERSETGQFAVKVGRVGSGG
jgi:hypothetical protein